MVRVGNSRITAINSRTLPPASFRLDFADLGAGAVSLVPGAPIGVSATFARADGATTIGSTGLVVSVATNVARSYYDPTTLEYLGYLAEGQRTNLCLQSEDFATTWTNVNSTEGVNAGVAPDGATTADRLIPSAAATDGAFLQTGLTLTANSTYTFSAWAKTGATFDSIQLRMGDNAFANSVSVTYNTTTGAVESAAAVAGTWTAASSTAKQYPNGYWRFTVTATATTNAGDRVSLVSPDTGDGTNGPLLWGADVELGAFASSYIATTTAAVTRNADVLTYPTSPWYSATAGTVMAQFQIAVLSGFGANDHILSINDTSVNNRVDLFLSAGPLFTAFIASGGASQLTQTAGGNMALGTSYKGVTAWTTNSGQTAQGGTLSGADDTTLTVPVSPSILNVGFSVGGTGHDFGTIRRIAYWPTRLSNAQLQSLTA